MPDWTNWSQRPSDCSNQPTRARALLDGYIAAFERSDAGLLEHVLRTDATLEATPFREWQAGRVNCIHMLDEYVLGAPGDWHMIATAANGQPAAVVYHRDTDNALRAHGIVVLAPTATGISRVTEFDNPALVIRFGFAEVLAVTSAPLSSVMGAAVTSSAA